MTFRIGRLLGIPIDVDLSWVLVFVLLAYSISTGYFARMFPGRMPAANLALGVAATALFFATLLAHELAHCYFARRSGIPIAGITLFIFGGVSRMKSEPASPSDEFRMAIAGPLTSFALALCFALLALLSTSGSAAAVLTYVAFANVLVGAFNLLPGFPLDGGRVLRSFVWHATNDLRKATRVSSFTGQALGWTMIIIGVANFLRGNTLGGVWLVFIGWFLNNAAQASYQQVLVRRAFEGLLVSDVMTPGFEAVAPETTLEDLVDEYFLRTHADTYPVVRDDALLGVVRLDELREVPRADWPRLQVSRIARPVDEAFLIGAHEPAWNALARMGEQGHSTLFVMDRNRLVGSVRQEYLARLLKLRMVAED